MLYTAQFGMSIRRSFVLLPCIPLVPLVRLNPINYRNNKYAISLNVLRHIL